MIKKFLIAVLISSFSLAMENLPDELHIEIFEYLPKESFKFIFVSKEWKKFIDKNLKTIVFEPQPEQEYKYFVNILVISHFNNLKSLKLKDINPKESKQLSLLTSLTYLDIDSECTFNESNFFALSHLTNLKSLYLPQGNGVRVYEYLVHLAPLTNLLNLDISGYILYEDDIKYINYLTKLNFLKLSISRLTKPELINSLSNLNNLEYLDLHYLMIKKNPNDPEYIKQEVLDLSYLTQLKYLQLIWLPKIEGNNFLTNLHNLRVLILKSCNKITHKNINDLSVLKNLKKLYIQTPLIEPFIDKDKISKKIKDITIFMLELKYFDAIDIRKL